MTTYTTILDRDRAAAYKRYLKAAGIYYEASECNDLIIIVVPLATDKDNTIYNMVSTAEQNLLAIKEEDL